ncbi:MAG: DUF6036 family nucleotidyltransferase [Oscillospiraceae bacterium]|nr:DUF6036 family nucleotidyltransferase [Oscillospiraceae bacterium]
MTLELICVGGYILQLHDYKYTVDVDAFYNSSTELDQIIQKVGDALGINRPDEPWLNNAVANMNQKPSEQFIENIFQFSNLIVNSANLNYVVGMKLHSGRDQDIDDIKGILKSKDTDLFTFKSELEEMGFRPDIAVLLDAYERAHGLEWLAAFYEENGEKLMQIIYEDN